MEIALKKMVLTNQEEIYRGKNWGWKDRKTLHC